MYVETLGCPVIRIPSPSDRWNPKACIWPPPSSGRAALRRPRGSEDSGIRVSHWSGCLERERRRRGNREVQGSQVRSTSDVLLPKENAKPRTPDKLCKSWGRWISSRIPGCNCEWRIRLSLHLTDKYYLFSYSGVIKGIRWRKKFKFINQPNVHCYYYRWAVKQQETKCTVN